MEIKSKEFNISPEDVAKCVDLISIYITLSWNLLPVLSSALKTDLLKKKNAI
jgi:hypothetical protein